MSGGTCPDRDALARFAVGDVDAAEFAQLAAHVEHCPACDAVLQTLDTHTDALVSGLRQPADDGADVPRALLAVARSALHPRPSGRVGKFELLEELGSGTFGTVFRARDTELGCEVAIKILRAGRLAGAGDTERFLREARSAAQLKHPGIVSLFEAGQTDDGVFYLVEELVRGATLADRLRDGPLDPRARAGLREPFILMGIVAGSLVGLTVAFAVTGGRGTRAG